MGQIKRRTGVRRCPGGQTDLGVDGKETRRLPDAVVFASLAQQQQQLACKEGQQRPNHLTVLDGPALSQAQAGRGRTTDVPGDALWLLPPVWQLPWATPGSPTPTSCRWQRLLSLPGPRSSWCCEETTWFVLLCPGRRMGAWCRLDARGNEDVGRRHGYKVLDPRLAGSCRRKGSLAVDGCVLRRA